MPGDDVIIVLTKLAVFGAVKARLLPFVTPEQAILPSDAQQKSARHRLLRKMRERGR